MTIGLLLNFLRNCKKASQFMEIESILSEAFECYDNKELSMKRQASIAYDVMLLFDVAGLRGESAEFKDSQHFVYVQYFQEMYEHSAELLTALRRVS